METTSNMSFGAGFLNICAVLVGVGLCHTTCCCGSIGVKHAGHIPVLDSVNVAIIVYGVRILVSGDLHNLSRWDVVV